MFEHENYAMFASENSDVEVIKNSLVEVTMAALYKNYGKTGLEREKEIKWLSMPRQIHGTVTEGNGTVETFMYLGVGSNNIFNSN
jgi:hypothetical protein